MTNESSLTGKSAKKTGFLRRYYDRLLVSAQGKHAWEVLALISFLEASCFPIPPDVMLLPMMLANRRKAMMLACWCTLWSLIGGLAGYAIGYMFWDSAGQWIIHALHISPEVIDHLRQEYTDHAYLIAIKGLTPIPFKIVTISAGLASVPLGAFLIYSFIARGLRFIVIEGALVYIFGEKARVFLEKYLGPITLAALVLIILGFVLVGYLA